MKKNLAMAAMAVVLMVSTPAAHAANAAAPAPAPAAAELTRMLTTFLDGAGGNDAAIHERFWADDLIYTGSGGRRIGKADIMKDVKSSPAPQPEDPKVTYGAEDVRIQQYGDAALLAFRLVATTVHGDTTTVAKYLNSGFFIHRKGEWRAVGWQATKLPQ
jgi:hypothetical protein